MIDNTDKFTIIYFEITNNCNKSCKFCIKMNKEIHKIKYMKIEDYKYVIFCINKRDRDNFRTIIITGGEPILHPQFIEIMRLVRIDFPKAEIKVQSNGRLLTKLPQKKLRILPNIKRIIFSVSHYPNWNDEIRERYDGHNKLPSLYRRAIRKFTMNNKFIEFISLDYRIPFIKKIRRFICDPLKRGNVYFKSFTGFRDPYVNPNLSKEKAKAVRKCCFYYIWVIDRKLYSCCVESALEEHYNLKVNGIEFDKNWKRNWFKHQIWKACAHCQIGIENYRITNIRSRFNYKKHKHIDLEPRRDMVGIKGHE